MLKVEPRQKPFIGEFEVPGDKSISHRVLIISSIAKGDSKIEGLLKSKDTMATLSCLRALGAEITFDKNLCIVKGKGLRGFSEPQDILNAENSGTTARLLLGILAAQPFFSVITGDESLRRRPMARVAAPLREMGAHIIGRCNCDRLPLAVVGRRKLKAIDFSLSVPSAQVKSAILLAGLYSEAPVTVKEPTITRDHTERMLSARGIRVIKEDKKTILFPGEPKGADVKIPGDFSSAAFLITAALLIPGSEIKIRNVGLNPTRLGFLKIIKAMGAKIKVTINNEEGGEPSGDIEVFYSPDLKAVTVFSSEIPFLIDEVPLLALLGVFAQGETKIEGAQELRVKESDRIAAVASQLSFLGARIKERVDGFAVEGTGFLKGGRAKSFSDHRIAMLLAIAGLVSQEGVLIDDPQVVDVSFPRFFETIGVR